MQIRGSNVAVFGGAGFLGSHMVNYLIDACDCNVVVIDNLMVGQKKFIHPKAKFAWCDITISESVIRRILERYKVDFVFNYIAMPYVPSSYERPLSVFDINCRGALMVINASQDAGVKGILQVSSAEIYGDVNGKIDEEHPAHPHSSYGASKLAIDALVQARWRENKTPCVALRQFNCVGERETHPYVIPEIIAQLSISNDVYLGNNSQRDFLYAGDAVAMATELLEQGKWGQVYNLGSEQSISIFDLARLIGDLMGKPKIQIIQDPQRVRKWEIWNLQSNNAKLYSVIKARPQVSLTQALVWTINDYHKNGWCWL